MKTTDLLNMIHLGDCLEVMKSLESESVDLIYLDPPFFTEKRHTLKTRDGRQEFSFDDIWGSDLEYAKFLHERILAMRRILRDSGSLFVHCDKKGEHIIRATLDTVFDAENFRSEIIWSYKRWSNARKGLLPAHQNIYFYSKTANFKFNTIYGTYSETTNLDQILQKRTRNAQNKVVYDTDENGDFQQSDPKRGVPLSDVWEIPYLNPKAKERVGYPTQKPLLLLERIIEIASDPNDVVLDPFCGSGTTCVAAKLLKRHYLGIDQSPAAVALSQKRLCHPIKTESNLLKKGRASYLNADWDALHLLRGMDFHPVQRNQGVDAILTELFENAPVLIRIQKKYETLAEAAACLIKAKKKKKAKKGILIQTQTNGLFEEVIHPEGIVVLQTPSVQWQKYLQGEVS